MNLPSGRRATARERDGELLFGRVAPGYTSDWPLAWPKFLTVVLVNRREIH